MLSNCYSQTLGSTRELRRGSQDVHGATEWTLHSRAGGSGAGSQVLHSVDSEVSLEVIQ